MKYIRAATCVGIALWVGAAAFAQAPRPAATQSSSRPAPQALPISATPMMMAAHVWVADLARSERFYGQVFGMTVSNVVSPREHALRFPNAGASASSIILLLATPPLANGGFLIQVPDIDAAVARVVAAGGMVTSVPNKPANATVPVRNAMITDPDGTRIELLQFIRS